MRPWRIAGAALACLALQATAGATNLTMAQPMGVTSITGSKSSTNGFFFFTASVPVSGCEAGYWLPAADSSYASALSAVKSALANQSFVTVSGDRDDLWPGSTDHYCRISQIQ